ncbi:hypothetical protein A1O3_02066 [Capronia epimyces CBS 606.96]|uniref:Uncharacterized protein n=1 Tax=Capronia epimyces CBS 606.96 TaxID=1182542 RepID=W9Y833_9EURO|nr:uncharacterized protein A1O3_02066 [Capronia epimyces CBS 606.96]EXJ89002.1 hypothetical protein A1O3_02066 [Capronia epimyces CBS 606.96]
MAPTAAPTLTPTPTLINRRFESHEASPLPTESLAKSSRFDIPDGFKGAAIGLFIVIVLCIIMIHLRLVWKMAKRHDDLERAGTARPISDVSSNTLSPQDASAQSTLNDYDSCVCDGCKLSENRMSCEHRLDESSALLRR